MEKRRLCYFGRCVKVVVVEELVVEELGVGVRFIKQGEVSLWEFRRCFYSTSIDNHDTRFDFLYFSS